MVCRPCSIGYVSPIQHKSIIVIAQKNAAFKRHFFMMKQQIVVILIAVQLAMLTRLINKKT